MVDAAVALFIVGLVVAAGAAGLRLGAWLYGPPEPLARLIARYWVHAVAVGAVLMTASLVVGIAA